MRHRLESVAFVVLSVAILAGGIAVVISALVR
jgi:hypothetical protein